MQLLSERLLVYFYYNIFYIVDTIIYIFIKEIKYFYFDRCNAKVQKVEKSALGTVYVCTHGAPKHSTKGCRRTYLSQRDLQSHIAHRHVPKSGSTNNNKHQPVAPLSQPGPIQMPLTQQQAAQQATQKPPPAQAIPVQAHTSNLSVAGSLVPPVSSLSLTHSQPSGLVNAQHTSPIPSHIPGLGDLRPVTNVSPAILTQNSPLMQPAPSPNSLQGIGMSYNAAPPTNPDIYRPLDMAAMGQQPPQLQQSIGMSSMHLQPVNSMQQYAQPSQFPVSPSIMQQMNNNQQIASSIANAIHQTTLSHQHPPLAGPQSLDSYKPPNIQSPIQTPPSRTNVNLITVPIQDEGQYRIQDEGQYRPLPYVNTSMANQANSQTYPPLRANLTNQSQGYSQPSLSSNSFSSSNSYPHMGGVQTQSPNIDYNHSQNMVIGHSQNMGGQPPTMSGQAQNMGIGHSQNLGSQGQNINIVHHQNMSGQNIGNQGQNLGVHGQTMGGPSQNMGGPPQNLGMVNNSLGMPPYNLQANNPGNLMNQRPGMVGGVHASNGPRVLSGSVNRTQGGGLMPTPGTVRPGINNHYSPAGHWQNPRVIQPRMTQGQPRPRSDNQFNTSGYYN